VAARVSPKPYTATPTSMTTLIAFCKSPSLKVAAGVLICVAAALELFDDAVDPLYLWLFGRDLDITVAHGALLMGIAHVLQALPDLMEKAQRLRGATVKEAVQLAGALVESVEKTGDTAKGVVKALYTVAPARLVFPL
jgi:hypothetical protein